MIFFDIEQSIQMKYINFKIGSKTNKGGSAHNITFNYQFKIAYNMNKQNFKFI